MIHNKALKHLILSTLAILQGFTAHSGASDHGRFRTPTRALTTGSPWGRPQPQSTPKPELKPDPDPSPLQQSSKTRLATQQTPTAQSPHIDQPQQSRTRTRRQVAAPDSSLHSQTPHKLTLQLPRGADLGALSPKIALSLEELSQRVRALLPRTPVASDTALDKSQKEITSLLRSSLHAVSVLNGTLIEIKMKEALAQTRCGQAEDNLQSALDKHDALEEQVAQEAINVAKQEIDLINHKLDTLNLVFAQLETSIHDRTKKKWEEHSSLRIALLKHLALGTEIPTQQMEQLQELWPSDPQQVDELIIQTGQRALQEINPDAPTVGFRTQRLTSWLTICYDPRIQGAMTSAQIGQCTLQEELNGPRNIALYSYPPAAQDPFLTLTQVLLAFPTTLVEFSHTPGLPQASVRITEVIKEFHQDHIKDHTMEANNPYGWWNITVNSLTDQYTPGPNPPPMPDMFEAEAELLLAQTDRNSQIYQDLLAVIRDEQSPSLETIKELVRLHRTHPLATAFLINLVSYEALPTSPQRASSTSQGIRRLITDISDPLFLRYLYSAQHRQRIPEQGITQFPPQGNTISALARQDTIQELTHLLEKFPSWMDPIERKFRTAIPQVGNKGDGHSSLLATLKAYTCPLPATEQPESAVESRPARLILESQEPETGTLLATLEDESNHDSGDADPASLVPAREAETGTLPAPVVEEPIEASGVADSPPVQAQKVRSRPATQGDAREARTAAKKPARRQRVAIEPQHSTQAFDDEL